jgi:hypothetical protein
LPTPPLPLLQTSTRLNSSVWRERQLCQEVPPLTPLYLPPPSPPLPLLPFPPPCNPSCSSRPLQRTVVHNTTATAL